MRKQRVLPPVLAAVGACGGVSQEVPTVADAGVDAQSAEVLAIGETGVDVQDVDVSLMAEVGAVPDASLMDASSQLPACAWPTQVDAGFGACKVGRGYLECDYPTGITYDDGHTMAPAILGCISDDLMGCPGVHATTGAPTCKSMCAPDQYAMECGVQLIFPPYPGFSGTITWEQTPDFCTFRTRTSVGADFSCCPCGW